MKRLFLSLLLALTVGCVTPTKTPTVEVLRPAFMDAVLPLQMADTTGTLRNICTVTSINRVAKNWLTAAHCVEGIEIEARWINGVQAFLLEANYETDIAVLNVPGYTAGRELSLAPYGPKWGEEVMVAGHPFGYPSLFLTKGWIANPSADIQGDKPYMAIQVTGAPGNSGSAVVNLKGEIVSVIQIGWGRTFGPMMGGATYDQLKWFARYFTP